MLPKKNWTDEVYNFLTSIREGKEVVAFDFDNTLIKNDFGEAVMEYILYSGMPKFKGDFSKYFLPNEIEAKEIWKSKFHSPKILRDFTISEYEKIIEVQGLEKGYRWTSFIFSGYSPQELRNLAREVWNKDKTISPYKEMKDLIVYFKKLQKDIFIVTASPTVVIQEIAGEFGIEEENVIGMNSKILNGIFTDEIIEPYTYGKGKVKALQKFLKDTPALAFGDSENDFELLKYSKKGIFIDKGIQKYKEKFLEIGSLIQPRFQ
ncbi:MAG: HAD-IB family phosphatase [Leptospiraceae bacterium]|nr:HAD-IB family phosphatase [Leptospiraceae bacterium]MCK6382577.1 HAD-IB family phosphatase [Leptospiraceae bacterium]NUM42118.1 HAD-IB family phosphatase [Leptospiraceae bacterium]